MSYQLMYQNGYELVVHKSLCRVVDSNGQSRCEGTYDECTKWLADRGVKHLGAAEKKGAAK